ncbi:MULTISPECIES: MFS transporter [Corallococcus]|uniref:MFS transporter n=1 Tax=Corallococcus TaxID=83461 RepID=UPI001180025E|nr:MULTISPECIES: MFS transporter [Corallococcus]NBD08424.1 MFS transporter [Corallococcus silvisoli]TSC34369.1 MFS transporter [Corallococcus sp. Z5C101001]
MTERSDSSRMWTFLVVWLGQFVSLVGSGMTTFALGFWVLEQTGSNTRFTLVAFFGVLPGVVALPLAGALVDRWGGRRAMLLADLGEGLCVLTAMLLAWTGQLSFATVCVLALVNSLFGAMRWPAYSTLPPLLLPARHLGRANGMIHAAEAGAAIVAPLAAGFLVTSLRLPGVLLMDLSTFVISMVTLLAVRAALPRPAPGPQPHDRAGTGRPSLGAEVAYGWSYIRARPGLWALLIFFAVTNFTVIGLARTLYTPLILGFTSPKALGTLLSIGGAGLLLGAAAMTAWGGPRRRIHGVLGFTLIQGVVIILGGLLPNAFLVGLSVFMLSFCFPIVTGSSQALWQSKVALDVQGRVFSVRRMLGWSSLPLAYLVGGPLADHVFEPLLAPGGALADSVGRFIGVGTGRGIALLYIVIGSLTVLTVIVSYQFARLRHVEDELPDALPSPAHPSWSGT